MRSCDNRTIITAIRRKLNPMSKRAFYSCLQGYRSYKCGKNQMAIKSNPPKPQLDRNLGPILETTRAFGF
jgi:hypothetical protein